MADQRQFPIKGRPPKPKLLRDLCRADAVRDQLERGRQLVGVERRPARHLAACAGSGDPVTDAFDDAPPFEMRDGAEDVKHQPAGR